MVAMYLLKKAAKDKDAKKKVDEAEEKDSKMPSKAEVMKCCKDGMSVSEICKKYPDCDQDKLKELCKDCKAEIKEKTKVPAAIWRPVRARLAVIRSIPLILVAMLMVGAVGLGPLPGILAITFHATGMLAKFYAEAIDNVGAAPLAALESAGASRAQLLRWAIWPQMAPVVLRDTVFRFELNLRESLILGIVGAGGIGLYVQTYVRSFQYDKAATVTLAIIALVLLFEGLNSVLQKRFS